MKLTLVLFAIIGTASAALPSSEYLPPLEDASPTSNVDLQSIAESTPLADDGYRYKVVKRYKLRHRRDVNELPSNDYLPPAESAPIVADFPAVSGAAIESEQTQNTAVLADDGYRYKTVKRRRYRHRRDVNELASNEYLPPAAETQVVEEAAPVVAAAQESADLSAPIAAAAQESAVLADDGYRYKTVRRIRYRRRRDVNELASNEYLPPAEETQVIEEAVPIVAAAQESAVLSAPIAAAAQESAVLADDGYRYKTVRRIRYRHRRDVNELASNEYLPPAEETQVIEEAAPVVAAAEESAVLSAPIAAAAQESAVLADDGYRYKTVRRIRYRRRRDVNELASNEYLPPAEETQVIEEATPVVAAAEESAVLSTPIAAAAQESAVLADDGYRYKTVRRIRYRRRRDVNELASNEYLPPAEETQVIEEATPVVTAAEESAVLSTPIAAAAQESAVLADDGYRYKTVRRIRYRRRRDVNELASNEYLPPAEETQVVEEAAPVVAAAQESAVLSAPVAAAAQESAVLADDGYRYKTVRRIRYRRRRDVNELASNEYLPPTEETQVVEEAAPVVAAAQESAVLSAPVAATAQESAVLADDGYRYKTVRRIRYRRRRDVNELASNEYLPPAEETQVIEEAAPVVAAAQESAVLSAPIAAAAQESAVLADDGYRYKTVRRIRYRHRRDVNELASNEYLPPAEETQVIEEAAPVVAAAQESAILSAPIAAAAQESAVLADDGYRYKTVRRIRYRRRRDVNELASNEYLPPAEETQVVEEAAPVVAAAQESSVLSAPVASATQESAVLADDGYRYKTVRRIRYRHRRDVNELASNEYLPPAEETQVVEEPAPLVAAAQESSVLSAPVAAAAQESAVLADDGYRYKTVRRIRYRHRRDVNELASNEYLPPAEETQVVEEAAPIVATAQESVVLSAPVAAAAQESAVLADDGYRYKTVRRIRYRHRRDVNELASNEYLPPAQETQVVEEAAPVVAVAQESAILSAPVAAAAQESTVLADDGYRYKTVRRVVFRHRS